jgi:hypothetical protein
MDSGRMYTTSGSRPSRVARRLRAGASPSDESLSEGRRAMSLARRPGVRVLPSPSLDARRSAVRRRSGTVPDSVLVLPVLMCGMVMCRGFHDVFNALAGLLVYMLAW